MFGNKVVFDRDEIDLIVAFAGCSLDESPGKNWVEEEGGLPPYICEIARAIKRGGKTASQAIAIAVSRAKKWAAGGDDVDAKTRAKAAKAVAQWEKLKAKAKAKGKTKKGDHVLAASNGDTEVLCLANADYNTDIVRAAWDTRREKAAKEFRKSNPGSYDYPEYGYVRELWTNFVIVASGYGEGRKLFKVPYAVDDKLNVTFSDPAEVKTQYVVVANDELDGGEITDKEILDMMSMSARADQIALDKILRLARS